MFSTQRTQTALFVGVTAFLFVLSNPTTAQPVDIPFHFQSYTLNSGMHDGADDLKAAPEQTFRETIRVPGAPWLQVLFEDYDLGKRSYITITSLEDRDEQRLDATSLPQWENASAFFNGDAVIIELHVAPGDKGVFFQIREIAVGERVGKLDAEEPDVEPLTICDGVDDRVPSGNLAVARTATLSNSAGCTGWVVSNGAYLSAGHCVGNLGKLQFNVPLSDSDGTPNHPPASDQYPIDSGSINSTNGGIGNDWAVYAINPNSNTGLLPTQAYGKFYRMTRDRNPTMFRVTGYGTDTSPPERNQTQQTDTGTNEGEIIDGPSDVHWTYRVDTEGGNSGSPVIVGTSPNSVLTAAIHTHGGCTSTGGSNKGTSFENNTLENAIQTFPGTNVTYVDNGHPTTIEDGTVFRPFDTVSDGVSAATAGGILSIVAGTYAETVTINKAMRIEAPVGNVQIDPGAAAALVTETDDLEENIVGENKQQNLPDEFSLAQNHPNPVAAVTTIDLTLPEASHVRLVVYDMLGREVARLVESQMQAGVYTVPFDASTLSSGVYVYRVQAGEYVESRRMLVVE